MCIFIYIYVYIQDYSECVEQGWHTHPRIGRSLQTLLPRKEPETGPVSPSPWQRRVWSSISYKAWRWASVRCCQAAAARAQGSAHRHRRGFCWRPAGWWPGAGLEESGATACGGWWGWRGPKQLPRCLPPPLACIVTQRNGLYCVGDGLP